MARIAQPPSAAVPPLAPAPPGTAPYPAALQARLAAAQAARTGEPLRTRHRRPDGTPLYTNRLILESSPYLQQHAHNPVDWYPWGEEAFARARAEGKPVFLSVGYSTCHWCHVMEEESFEDEAIADYLNRHYVAIKVDREQRPDVDAVYMEAVQRMSGSGGWPMTVWLTADREPFWGGTYFPPRDGARGVRVGLQTLLARLADAYATHPDDVRAAAADVSRQVRAELAPTAAAPLPDAGALRAAVATWRRQFDAANGGFGGRPKFPRPVQLQALLRWQRRSGDADALAMVTRTLAAMAAGGVHDQVGGGFHRYATDARWRVPHFEKMLYDNALLAVAYLEAYQASGDPDFATVARDTLAYLAAEMAAPGGGFFAASDADSDGGEGRYFTWTADEMAAALTASQWPLVRAVYGLDATVDGRSVPYVAQPLGAAAAALGVAPDAARRVLDDARARLAAARRARPAPFTDRKRLAGWNGLAISAFARASVILGDPTLAAPAVRAAESMLAALWDGTRLQRGIADGHPFGEGVLDDYVFLAAGLLDLYEATFDPRWLRSALALTEAVELRFRDPEHGGYFLTAGDAEPLLARAKPAYDGAEPSGNAVALLTLLRLRELSGDDRYRRRAEALLGAFAPALGEDPTAMPLLLVGLDFWLDRAKEIVIVTPHAATEAEPFLAALRTRFLPNRVLVVIAEPDRDALAALVPLVADKVARGGRATAYVCERGVCDLPTTDPAVFARQIDKVEPLPR